MVTLCVFAVFDIFFVASRKTSLQPFVHRTCQIRSFPLQPIFRTMQMIVTKPAGKQTPKMSSSLSSIVGKRVSISARYHYHHRDRMRERLIHSKLFSFGLLLRREREVKWKDERMVRLEIEKKKKRSYKRKQSSLCGCPLSAFCV